MTNKKLYIIFFLFILNTMPAYPGIKTGAFLGLSGIGLAAVTADVLLETEGEISAQAFEWGLFTGEVGLMAELALDGFSTRSEILYGSYKFQVLSQPSESYQMLMAGQEFLGRHENYFFGGGLGIFTAWVYHDFLGTMLTPGTGYIGNSNWVTFGIIEGSTEINLRLRWHYFWQKGENDETLNDYALILRGGIHF